MTTKLALPGYLVNTFQPISIEREKNKNKTQIQFLLLSMQTDRFCDPQASDQSYCCHQQSVLWFTLLWHCLELPSDCRGWLSKSFIILDRDKMDMTKIQSYYYTVNCGRHTGNPGRTSNPFTFHIDLQSLINSIYNK